MSAFSVSQRKRKKISPGQLFVMAFLLSVVESFENLIKAGLSHLQICVHRAGTFSHATGTSSMRIKAPCLGAMLSATRYGTWGIPRFFQVLTLPCDPWTQMLGTLASSTVVISHSADGPISQGKMALCWCENRLDWREGRGRKIIYSFEISWAPASCGHHAQRFGIQRQSSQMTEFTKADARLKGRNSGAIGERGLRVPTERDERAGLKYSLLQAQKP